MEQLKKIIQAMVISNAGKPLTVSQLNRDFKDFEGYDIPYEKHGFRQLDAMLRSMSDAVQINGQGPSAQLMPVLTANSKHIREMVEKQKNKNGKRKVQYSNSTLKKRRIEITYDAPKKAPEPVAKSTKTNQKQDAHNVRSAKNRWDQQSYSAPTSTKHDSLKWTRSNFTQLSADKTNGKQGIPNVLYLVSNNYAIKTSTGYGNYATADQNNNRNYETNYGNTGNCGYGQNGVNTQRNCGNGYGTYNTNAAARYFTSENSGCYSNENSGYMPYGAGYISNSNGCQNSGNYGNYYGNTYNERYNSIDSRMRAYCMDLLNYFNESTAAYETVINALQQYSQLTSQGLSGSMTKAELLITLTRIATQIQQIHNLLIYSHF